MLAEGNAAETTGKKPFGRADDDAEAIMNVASEHLTSRKLNWYISLSPQIDEEQSSILAGLQASTVEVICEKPRVRAIRLGNGAKLVGLDFAGDTIYERNFYPQLVRDMRTARSNVLLLGNSGVGKSMFQYYLLARYMNPAHFQDTGSAPPTRRILFGSAAPPKVVIRHLPGEFHVLFLEKGVAHLVTSQEVLRCFDPATTLYFYEPGQTRGVEPVGLIHALPTLATMSPDESRYKEFRKDATTMYCPVYTGEELLAIGGDMRQAARGFPDELLDLYSDANISERFDDFNGIFRYVLPKSADDVKKNLEDRDAYLKTSSMELIDANLSTLVQRVAGTFALVYEVDRLDTGDWDFCSKSFVYAGPHVLKLVRKAYATKTIKELQRRLREVDELNARYNAQVPELFEEVVARLLTERSGVRWELRRVGDTPVVETLWLEVQLQGPIEGKPPAYDKMVVNKLYLPDNRNHPNCDMMYKDSTGTLVCIQVSWKKDRKVTSGPFLKFCKAMGLCAKASGQLSAAEEQRIQETVRFVFCPRPQSFDAATLTFETGCILQGGDIMGMGKGFKSGVEDDAS